MVAPAIRRLGPFVPTFGGAWPMVLGFAALAFPTAIDLARQEWSRESGAHGPIVLATGGWLLWRQISRLRLEGVPGNPLLTVLLLAGALAFYVFGRAYDFLTLEAGGLWGVGIAMLHARLGARALLKAWFPFVYLAFSVPPPQALLDAVTAPLKHFVSFVVTDSLAALGLPVARQGVTIFIAQYQLLMEDACSGMNSLFGLTAISLLYIHLARGSSWFYSLILTALVVPIAIAANIVRVVTLVLVTYLFGDEAGQGFTHLAAGILLFATALLLVFAVDQGLQLAWPRRSS